MVNPSSGLVVSEILQAIEAISKCRTPQEVGGVVTGALAGYGLTTFAIGGMPPPSDPNPTPFTFHNWPDIWSETYLREGFGAVDPIPRAAMITAMPFTLAELQSGQLGQTLGPECDAYFAAARAIGRGAALIVPIHGPFGYHGIAVFAGPRLDMGPNARACLHLLAIYAHNRMLTLYARGSPALVPQLTPREVEVLRHARNGLTDDAVATQTGITVRTVRFHFENARKRLGAKTRAEALLLAASHHLLGA